MMATHRETWKRLEREAARFFGAERVALSGSVNTQAATSSDSDSERVYVESKLRARWSIWSLFRDVEGKARREGKAPVLALREKGKGGWLIVCRPDDLATLASEHRTAEVMMDG